MHEGVVQQVAPPKDIYDYPANKYIAGFIGSPGMNFIDGKLVEAHGGVYFQADAFSIPISEEQSKVFYAKGYVGHEIILGIRPEDILANKEGNTASQQTIVQGIVDLAEDMGSETYLYVKVGGNVLTARVEGRNKQTIGHAIQLAFNMKKAHFFDIETEEAIR
ncbi:MAG: TOBE domain-containing protein [Bacillus sp. (in: firmicutes)]